MRDVGAAHVADLERLAAYLGVRDGVEEISRDELAERLRAGDVIVLDVRAAAEFEADRVLGAPSTTTSRCRRSQADDQKPGRGAVAEISIEGTNGP